MTTEKIVHDFTINLLNALKDFRTGKFVFAEPSNIVVITCWTPEGARELTGCINDIAQTTHIDEFLNVPFPDHAVKRLTAVIVSYVEYAEWSDGNYVRVHFRDGRDNIQLEEFLEVVGNYIYNYSDNALNNPETPTDERSKLRYARETADNMIQSALFHKQLQRCAKEEKKQKRVEIEQ